MRCGGVSSAWHHRRSRRVHDDHTHCSCNGISLCNRCHTWVHAHPYEAITGGWIVPTWVLPTGVRMWTIRYGWVRLTCYGTLILLPTRNEDVRPEDPRV